MCLFNIPTEFHAIKNAKPAGIHANTVDRPKHAR